MSYNILLCIIINILLSLGGNMGKIVIIMVVLVAVVLGTIIISVNRRSEEVPKLLSANFQDIGSYALQYAINQVVMQKVIESAVVDYSDDPFEVLDGQINSIEYVFNIKYDSTNVGTDPGLVGGHFDVDVFNEPTSKELYHKHEFDDEFDITYIDIVNDFHLLYDVIIGDSYPNNLRVEFFNADKGSGTYIFQTSTDLVTGNTQDGFGTTFNPSDLLQLKVSFASLNDLRDSEPKTVQNDINDRDGAFSVRMYDVVSNNLVYELSTYHHIKKGEVVVDEVFEDKYPIIPVGSEVTITANVSMTVNDKDINHDSRARMEYEIDLVSVGDDDDDDDDDDDIMSLVDAIIESYDFKILYWNP